MIDETEDREGRQETPEEVDRRAPTLTRHVLRALYDKGMTDSEIGATLGVSSIAVAVMREAMGLPAHTRLSTDRRRRAFAEGVDDPYQGYYDAKMTDAQIARMLGVTRSAVYEWRQGKRLPAHRSRKSTDECWRYYIRGLNDREIAAITGIKEATIRHWRYRYDLPAVSRFTEKEDDAGKRIVTGKGQPDYQKYYDQGWNDAEIAAAVNRTQSAVQTWRRNLKLTPNIVGRPNVAETHVPVDQRQDRRVLVGTKANERPQRPVRQKGERAAAEERKRRTG